MLGELGPERGQRQQPDGDDLHVALPHRGHRRATSSRNVAAALAKLPDPSNGADVLRRSNFEEFKGRLAAIVDFTFNLGAGRLQTSTLRRRINQRDWPTAASELRRWVYGGGKVLPGLVTRREAEVAWLLRNA